MMYDMFEDRGCGRRGFDKRYFSEEGGFGPDMDRPHCMPRGFGGGHGPGGPGGFGCESDGFGPGPGGPGGGLGPSGPGGFGRDPGGFGRGPGGFGHGPGGFGPRRPDPDFLKRRVEDADLMELIDMAGRMTQRRPRGGAARGQSLILSILAGREVLSQRELQQMLGIQPGSLSELLSKLEAKGYLTREKAEDRRGNLLRITDAGREAIPRVDDAPEDEPFAPLTDEQQDQLAGLLRTLLSRWAEDMEPPCPRGRRVPPQKPVEV